MQLITVSFTPAQQAFPAGTVQAEFAYALLDSTGATVDSGLSAASTFTFPNAHADGTYTVAVSCLGVSTTASITLAPTTVTLNVPSTLTVTAAPAP